MLSSAASYAALQSASRSTFSLGSSNNLGSMHRPYPECSGRVGNSMRGCKSCVFAAYYARSIDELSGRTTSRLGHDRQDSAYNIGGTADLAPSEGLQIGRPLAGCWAGSFASVLLDLSKDYGPTGSSGRRRRLRRGRSTCKGLRAGTDPPDGYAGVHHCKWTTRPHNLSGAGQRVSDCQSDAQEFGSKPLRRSTDRARAR
jgi:hypothetical protein